MNSFYLKFLLIIIALVFIQHKGISQTQADTMYAYLTHEPVLVDGEANEACWETAKWHAIDQVWLPFGQTMKAGDFEGRFKLAWDSLYLYLLVEIVDDSLSDDHSNPLDSWWDDDCLEVFIDEDRSKGDHERNNNAFAYHVSLSYDAIDLSSSGSGVNYKDNLKVEMDTIGENKYLWELAIKNYKSSFKISDPEASRVYLYHKKLMGFSIAYCDNDETKGRENFIGNMKMTAANSNDNYKTANHFGTLLLIDPDYVDRTSVNLIATEERFRYYPNPVNDQLFIELEPGNSGVYELELLSVSGKVIQKLKAEGKAVINTSDLPKGAYLLSLKSADWVSTKMVVKE